ncbi:MAG: protein-disulfide reductase DsbD family protein [Rhodobacter sp.]|nr:protein-disulfide reductase DsbD family protein [Rhodobacter sp.]
MPRLTAMLGLLKFSALSLCLSYTVAFADSDHFSLDDVVQFDVLPGWRTETGTHVAALRVRLAPGWKTYWRAPGETSVPPRFDWSGSRNLASVDLHWPVPEVFFLNGLRSVGYSDELVLPIELTPHSQGKRVALRSEVALGVCKDICMPVNARISADLSGRGNRDPRIDAALESRPLTAGEAGLKTITCEVEPISDGLRLTADIDMPEIGSHEVVVFELPDRSVWVADASTLRTGNRLTAVTELVPPSGKPFLLDRSSIRVTVLSGERAVDIDGCAG